MEVEEAESDNSVSASMEWNFFEELKPLTSRARMDEHNLLAEETKKKVQKKKNSGILQEDIKEPEQNKNIKFCILYLQCYYYQC